MAFELQTATSIACVSIGVAVGSDRRLVPASPADDSLP
jgi:hypothetical protein